MSISSTTSMLGAALGIQQANTAQNFALRALSDNHAQQDAAIMTLLQGTTSAGGSVTETRGQNLNILV